MPSDWWDKNVDRPWCEVQAEGCYGRASETHHRKLRSQGGDNDQANLLRCCSHCHLEIHRLPGLSYEHGWLVKSWQDPAAVPVTGWVA